MSLTGKKLSKSVQAMVKEGFKLDKLTFAQLSALTLLVLMPLLSGMGKELIDMVAAVRRHRKSKEDKTK